jgi:hypothetical protein
MTTKIYKLSSLVNDKVYIGSTCNPLNVRMAQHILSHYAFKSGNNSTRVSSFDIIDTEEYKIELLEECSIQDRFIREQYFIDTIKCINKNSAYTGIQGNQKTKESWAFYQRQHYAKNRDAHLARKIRYKNNNRESIRNKYKIKKIFQQLPFSLI